MSKFIREIGLQFEICLLSFHYFSMSVIIACFCDREKKDDRWHNASLGRVLIVINRPHRQVNLGEKHFDEI